MIDLRRALPLLNQQKQFVPYELFFFMNFFFFKKKMKKEKEKKKKHLAQLNKIKIQGIQGKLKTGNFLFQ